MLVFDEAERGPSDDLALQFEAVSHMPDEERRIIRALLDGMIIKYQTKQMVGNLSSYAGAADRRLHEQRHSHPGHRREWLFCLKEA